MVLNLYVIFFGQYAVCHDIDSRREEFFLKFFFFFGVVWWKSCRILGEKVKFWGLFLVFLDRPNLQNVEYITVLHNHLLDSLKVGIASRRPVESVQLLDDFLDLLRGWNVLDLMQEKYVHPIDLSQMAQGPWKIGEAGSSAVSVSSKSSDAGTVSPAPSLGPVKQPTVEPDSVQSSVAMES